MLYCYSTTIILVFRYDVVLLLDNKMIEFDHITWNFCYGILPTDLTRIVYISNHYRNCYVDFPVETWQRQNKQIERPLMLHLN